MIHKADEYEILTAGINVDILANQQHMGEDFAKRRIERKSEVYRSTDTNLDLFVCYADNKPIGNCELLHNDNIVKIEDFDILTDYQRKGYGTQFLKFLLEEAHKYGSEIAYLVTDQEDSAKEMYTKCGFSKVGENTFICLISNNNAIIWLPINNHSHHLLSKHNKKITSYEVILSLLTKSTV